VINYQIVNIDNLCSPTNKISFTCPGYNTFFTASIIFGGIGPKRLFGAGQIYSPLLWGFLVGVFLPIPFYFLARRYPQSAWKYVHVPAMLAGCLGWAPFNLSNILPGTYFAVLFQSYIKRHYLAWWMKYTYVLATALTTGIAISGVFIFIVIQGPNIEPTWAGNELPYEGCDAAGCPLMPLPSEGFFGPGPGEFS